MGKSPKKPGVKMAGKKMKLCLHDILKKSCLICSPHLFCPCKKLIKSCPKCKQFAGKKCCDRSRATCRLHGGISTHLISHRLTHDKYYVTISKPISIEQGGVCVCAGAICTRVVVPKEPIYAQLRRSYANITVGRYPANKPKP
jgi:hypothetical protein